jgi:hypothetical protein
VSQQIVISRRFCGPPDSGNGGYACGLVAAHVHGIAEVTLRRPPPLDTALAVVPGHDGSVRLVDGDQLVAEGRIRDVDLGIDVPAPVGIAEAEAAGRGAWFVRHPEEHPFPTCFVCGPQRAADDGLHILVGPVPERDVAADAWTPSPDLAAADGVVRPELVWAALDCSGGIGSFGMDLGRASAPFVLGRLAARVVGPVRVGEPHAVVGWRIGRDGRKLGAGSAMFTDAGELVALARATWIQLSG